MHWFEAEAIEERVIRRLYLAFVFLYLVLSALHY
jgi:hypothetical protein